MYRYFLKRLLDFTVSLIALILLLPIFIIVAILVRLKLGSPIIFKQKRPGKDCKIFTMYKFRTMTNEKDKDGNLLDDDIRFTKFGKFLRATSLDELPQLFNILIGDMSIVGPRPKLISDMIFFDDEAIKRQKVRPGLTGLAQAIGRNGISWEETFKYDLLYVEKYNILMDIKIIFKTAIKVFKKENIDPNTVVTSKYFGEYLLKTGQISDREYEEKLKLMENYNV